jgi:hypothetical protein
MVNLLIQTRMVVFVYVKCSFSLVPMTPYCMTNMTVVGAFLSRHKQLTPISAHKSCKTREGGGERGLFVVRLPTAKVGKVCGLAHKLKFARFASSNI